ncbi:glycosyltransferase family 2 protein [Roseibacillus persicicus]|uniref:glycosyltransferase family 2 protein n=1 Tax=Roseibacillus persicicus TaxID=454148 RepID=UPI00398B3A20
MISVLILTKNEQQDLPGCLESVAWCDDVHVFDSESCDATVELAQAHGAHVTTRKFDGYAKQRNAALKGIEFAHDWVLILDADERIPEECANVMRLAVKEAGEAVAFRLRRRDFLFGTWLKHAQISPFYIRLVRPDRVHYEREINEVLIADGLVVDLAEPFNHFPFSKGIAQWVDKHNRYSSMEAKRWLEEQDGTFDFSWKKAFFGKDFNEKRYHQKGLFFRMPGRPFIKLFYMLVWRRALLDGSAGVTYSMLQAIYEYFIVVKQRELIAAAKGEVF